MCGIVGYIGKRDATPVLVEGLHRLEYRGYDSAGVALVHRGRLQVTKTAGRVQDLRDRLDAKPVKAPVGIGHTRWATHGEPNDTNAHPHTDTAHRVAVVHNGIIENADALRAQLEADGVKFVTDTDTEALAHMVAAELAAGDDVTLEAAVIKTLRSVEGTYGLVVLDIKNPDQLVVARNGSPIVLGLGESEMFVASDVAALVRYTRQVVYLEDGEVATIKATDYRTTMLTGAAGNGHRTPTTVDADADDYELGAFSDYMRKEIHEQPDAIRRAVMGRLDERFATAKLGGVSLDARELRNIKRVKFLGCGSAYYAGQMGAALVEELARIPADAEPASEFRYRSPVVDPETLYVAVSQSGETSDTLMAVQELKRKGGQVMGAVNVVGSAIGRECGHGIFLHAGPEVAVASTKALTNMTRQLRPARAAARPGQGPVGRQRRPHRQRAAQPAVPGDLDPQQRGGDRRHRPPVRRGESHVLHRPGPRLAGGPRGRAEAQGDLLRARRGLPGRRAEARAAGADRAGHAQRGDHPVR